MSKTKLKPKHKFYTAAAHALSRKAPSAAIYDMAKEYEITKEEVEEYFKTITISKAVSGALMASSEEKEAIYNQLDEKFITQYTNLVILRRGENMFFYQYDGGYYKQLLLCDMQNLVDGFMAQYSLFDYRTNRRAIKDTVERISSLLSRHPKRYFNDEDLLKRKWYLNLKNGLLDMETFTLTPHTPDYFSTVQVPYEYNPEAEYPLFKEFLKKVSGESESTILMIQEMFGYSIQEGNPRHKVFYLYGDTARNGKSTTAKLLCGLVGWGNVSTLSLAQIGNDNSMILTSLLGKQINFSDELSSKYIESSRLTSMSAEGLVEINPKHKSPFLHQIRMKFIIACNDLPRFKDSQGMKHRMISIPFPYQIPEKDRIDRYDEILLEKEGSGILNFAIAGAKLMKSQKTFTVNDESRADMEDNNLNNNPVYAFLEMEYDFSGLDEDEVTLDDLYGQWDSKNNMGHGFKAFCHFKGLSGHSYFTFAREVTVIIIPLFVIYLI